MTASSRGAPPTPARPGTQPTPNEPQFAALSRPSLADSAARQLRAAILGGTYQPGDVLPSERELASQFGVDRHTLRSALLELELLGLLDRRQGSGCRVNDFRDTGSLDLLPHLVYLTTGEPDARIIGSILELGNVLFRSFLDLALAHSTPDDVKDMRAQLKVLDEALGARDLAAVVAAHRGLVRSLWRGGHSIPVDLLLNTFVKSFDAAVDPSHDLRERWVQERLPGATALGYRNLVDAIERGDREAAHEALATVTNEFGSFLVGLLFPGLDVAQNRSSR